MSSSESTSTAAITTTTEIREPSKIPTTTSSSADENTNNNTERIPFDIKDCVVLFGKLAEKYIVLDISGGQCCYSGCSNCEYRLPGGGYIMSDQSSSRPKWIPTYVHRTKSNNDVVTSKWSTMLFPNVDKDDVEKNAHANPSENAKNSNHTNNDTSNWIITKQDFVNTIYHDMVYVPPLGGPYVSASYVIGSSSSLSSIIAAIEYWYDILSNSKHTLSKTRMSVKLKQIANGQEGLTWPNFYDAMMMKGMESR